MRWVKWLGDAVQGDFGRSFSTQQSISTILADKLPVTIKIMVFAQVIAVMIAIPWAVIAASRANKPFDNASTGLSFGLLALPNFATGRHPPVGLREETRLVPEPVRPIVVLERVVVAVPSGAHPGAGTGGRVPAAPRGPT